MQPLQRTTLPPALAAHDPAFLPKGAGFDRRALQPCDLAASLQPCDLAASRAATYRRDEGEEDDEGECAVETREAFAFPLEPVHKRVEHGACQEAF